MSKTPHFTLSTDVLVLGSGLAGLRAAISAATVSKKSRVVLVSPTSCASGSSFALFPNRLGMQVCLDDKECEAFQREVCKYAAPGFVDETLVRVLAEESCQAFMKLQSEGVRFRKTADGLLRLNACFSPASKRAVVMDGMGSVFVKLRKKALSRGVILLDGYEAISLLQEDCGTEVLGAVLQHTADTNHTVAVCSGTTILGTGGPSTLFRYSKAPRHRFACGYGLLAESGARTVNMGYMQYMWSDVASREFVSIHNIANGSLNARKKGVVVPAPDNIAKKTQLRSTHCPIGHGTPDRSIDNWLLTLMENKEYAEIVDSGNTIRHIAPFAHASNGGAVIDANGQTTVQRLYACGECASGMHGANRIGGAMILATQVFGHKSGCAAARSAESLKAENGSDTRRVSIKRVKELAADVLNASRPCTRTRQTVFEAVADVLQGQLFNGLDPEEKNHVWGQKLEGLLNQTRDRQSVLALRTAITLRHSHERLQG